MVRSVRRATKVDVSVVVVVVLEECVDAGGAVVVADSVSSRTGVHMLASTQSMANQLA